MDMAVTIVVAAVAVEVVELGGERTGRPWGLRNVGLPWTAPQTWQPPDKLAGRKSQEQTQ